MSAALFDFIQTIKPSLGDEERAKIGLLIIHYITLVRVSNGGVKLDNVLTKSGKPFARKVLSNMSLVLDLAFALKVDTSCPYDDSPVPAGLRRLCVKYHIDAEACIRRNKKVENARGEMRGLVIFVRVALAIMAALHEDTLRHLDESYRGHRSAGYKPKPKWFGLTTDDSVPPVLARDLPRAKSPRAVGLKPNGTPASTCGPAPMDRKISDESSTSASSSGSKSTRKRSALPPPLAPRSNPAYGLVPPAVPMVPSSPAAYYDLCFGFGCLLPSDAARDGGPTQVLRAHLLLLKPETQGTTIDSRFQTFLLDTLAALLVSTLDLWIGFTCFLSFSGSPVWLFLALWLLVSTLALRFSSGSSPTLVLAYINLIANIQPLTDFLWLEANPPGK
ncbi:hypothetical protein RSAG8_02725, partial [Rhizoctonia solani AG-8 WAC10335]